MRYIRDRFFKLPISAYVLSALTAKLGKLLCNFTCKVSHVLIT
ncbi:MAG: hypothetical protein PUJ71_04865 [Clostridiales bacterium]|nr:hypothetical protein [Clostridiales bacterium]